MKDENMLDSEILQAQLNGMTSYMYSHHTVDSWL
jgi:hypothetical protein